MRILVIFFITALIGVSACSGLRKTPGMTSSGMAAYGVQHEPPVRKKKQIKVKPTKKSKGYSRSTRGAWAGG